MIRSKRLQVGVLAFVFSATTLITGVGQVYAANLGNIVPWPDNTKPDGSTTTFFLRKNPNEGTQDDIYFTANFPAGTNMNTARLVLSPGATGADGVGAQNVCNAIGFPNGTAGVDNSRYLRVDITAEPSQATRTYFISRANVCSQINQDNQASNNSGSNVLYARYRLPPAPALENKTNMMRYQVRITYNTPTPSPDSGGIRVVASVPGNANARLSPGTASRSFPIIGSWQDAGGPRQHVTVPFGMCEEGNTIVRRTIGLYDADNTNDPNHLFYGSNLTFRVKDLSDTDGDPWVRMYPPANPNGTLSNGDTVFTPDYGTTNTAISSALIDINVSHFYELHIYQLHTRNTVDIRLPNGSEPGWGDPLMCKTPIPPPPPSTSVTPRAVINPATTLEPGDLVTASTDIVNNGTNTGYVDVDWNIWYDRTDDQTYNSGDGDLLLSDGTPQSVEVSVAGILMAAENVTADQTYRNICAEIAATARPYSPPTVPVVTTVTTSPVKTCEKIERRPYFEVLHGDVNAAASLTTAGICAPASGTILGVNKGAAFGYKGSGAAAAAFAAGAIQEFTSATTYTGPSLNYKPFGLIFANPTGVSPYPGGGGFTTTYCIPDYWSNLPNTDQTITNQQNVRTSGDVFINSDYSFGGPIDSPSTTFTINNIPYRWVIADNIYIASDVTRLDGIYIAKGKIYTCATGIRSPVPITSMATTCGNPLQVRGSFTAGDGVKLQRTYDKLSGSPAEQFIYTPETWLQALRPAVEPPIGDKESTDSITILPPVL